MHIHGEPDGRTGFTVDEDVGEDGGAGDVKTRRDQKTPCDCHGLDSLIDGARPDALHIDGNAIFNHARNGTRNRSG